MGYAVLGELQVIDSTGEAITIRARKVAILFAVLLTKANQVVTTDQLMTEIWGEKPPNRASAALYVYISQLRKILRTDGSSDSPVLTRNSGYILRVGPGEFDVDNFDRLFRQGREYYRLRQYGPAAAALEKALSLWRGPAFGGLVNTSTIFGYASLLDERRLECIELLIDTELAAGRHRETVGRLYALINEYPLREELYIELMRALHRCHRRADALEVYHIARRRLNEEVGIEPCRSLRDLHQSILSDTRGIPA